jgi:hypothetical protein
MSSATYSWIKTLRNPRQPLELADELRGEPGIRGQVAHRVSVVLEALPAPGGELTGDIDHELAHGQEREEHVVVEREVAFEDVRRRHARPKLPEVVEVSPQLGEAGSRRA